MKGFLNQYMAANRNLEKQSGESVRSIFEQTVSAILSGIGDKAFRPFGSAVNAATLESLMVGVASRIEKGPINDLGELRVIYEELLKSTDYIESVTKSTADEDSVATRLRLSKEFFAQMQ